MKKFAITSIALIFLLSVASTQALAGSKQQHRWEGVAIGVGATLLGAALLSEHSSHDGYRVSAHIGYPPRDAYRHSYGHSYKHSYRHSHRDFDRDRHHKYRRGHWETRRVWVGPVHDRVWNPPHYNRRGHRIPGSWITVERSPGYWKEERVWRSRR